VGHVEEGGVARGAAPAASQVREGLNELLGGAIHDDLRRRIVSKDRPHRHHQEILALVFLRLGLERLHSSNTQQEVRAEVQLQKHLDAVGVTSEKGVRLEEASVVDHHCQVAHYLLILSHARHVRVVSEV